MDKKKKHIFWTIFISIIAILTIQASSLKTIIKSLDNMIDEYTHLVDVILRFERELGYPTPTGRYYISLLYKHDREFSTFIQKYPEHTFELVEITKTFVPGTEALLDGKGNTVQITEDQIRRLQVELDWMATIASPSLKEDIKHETQRYPLENFIGMTMDEAWAYMQSDFPSEPYIPPEPTPIPFEICYKTPEPGFLEKQNLVPDSNEEWASYVLGGVYFEYPSSWRFERKYIEHPGCNTAYSVVVKRGTSNVELSSLFVAHWAIENSNPESILENYIHPDHPPLWAQPVYITGFQGIKTLSDDSDSESFYFEVFLYNEENQVVFYSCIYIYGENANLVRSSPELVVEKHPELLRIIESVRVWEP